MAKRTETYLDQENKRAAVHQQLRAQWLSKCHAGEDLLDAWEPKLSGGFSRDWQEAVLAILVEEYSCADAKVQTVSIQKGSADAALAHAVSVNFTGRCPHHKREHTANKWTLINTSGYSTTMFICHHDATRKLIQHRLPIPLDTSKIFD